MKLLITKKELYVLSYFFKRDEICFRSLIQFYSVFALSLLLLQLQLVVDDDSQVIFTLSKTLWNSL